MPSLGGIVSPVLPFPTINVLSSVSFSGFSVQLGRTHDISVRCCFLTSNSTVYSKSLVAIVVAEVGTNHIHCWSIYYY